MKLIPDAILDAMLDILGAATIQAFCSTPPTTYTQAFTTYSLANGTLAGGDFSKANGDSSGRKLSVGAKTGVTIATSGIATHRAFGTSGSSTLLLVTEVSEVFQTGTAQAGASSTITLASGASASDDAYNGYGIRITSGTGAGQSRMISDYVGSTKVATVNSAWSVQPDNTSVYEVFGMALVANGSNTVDFGAFDVDEISDLQ